MGPWGPRPWAPEALQRLQNLAWRYASVFPLGPQHLPLCVSLGGDHPPDEEVHQSHRLAVPIPLLRGETFVVPSGETRRDSVRLGPLLLPAVANLCRATACFVSVLRDERVEPPLSRVPGTHLDGIAHTMERGSITTSRQVPLEDLSRPLGRAHPLEAATTPDLPRSWPAKRRAFAGVLARKARA